MADQAETPDRDAGYWQRKIIDAVAGHGIPPLTFERIVGYTQELAVLARVASGCQSVEDRMHEPVASELDIEMAEQAESARLGAMLDAERRMTAALKARLEAELDIKVAGMLRSAASVSAEGAAAATNAFFAARHLPPPPSAHGGAPPVIPPAGVYGDKVLRSATIAPWPSPPKVGVFNSRTGSTWFSVEGTTSFDRTMADANWEFMGWLELRNVPSA